MPRAEIASKQAVYTLGLLHAELAGKLLANKREAIRLRTAMMHAEAVVKMLQPDFNVCGIAAKRRNKSWWPTRPLRPPGSRLSTCRRLSLPPCGDGGWRGRASPLAVERGCQQVGLAKGSGSV